MPTTLLAAVVGELAGEGRVKAQTASTAHSASRASTNEAGVWVYIIATNKVMADRKSVPVLIIRFLLPPGYLHILSLPLAACLVMVAGCGGWWVV